jgi:glycosyltransferase involved in cell wall biosynthesis
MPFPTSERRDGRGDVAPPHISIVIPCFNAARDLPRAVESVLQQAIADVEILVVDDGSVDDTVAVAERLAARHPQIAILRQKANGGPAAARNAGLAAARGRFVGFLDADDGYAPGAFARILERFAAAPGAAAVVVGIDWLEGDRDFHPVQARAAEGSAPGNLLVRRSVALLIGGFPTSAAFAGRHAGEDVAFREVLRQYFAVEYIDARLYRHYLRPGCHFYRFLDRSTVVDGRLVFTRPAEHAETLLAGISAHRRRFEARLRAVAFVRRDAMVPTMPARPA